MVKGDPMAKFEFNTVTRIIFGRGELARIGELAGQFGSCALVVYNADEPAGKTEGVLKAAGIRARMLPQNREPQIRDVDGGVDLARREKCDVVIGLGGGSAIDAAKAIAGLLGNGGAATDYMEVVGQGRKIACPAVPWIAVPTTAGTGAEMTRNAVIGWPEKRFKASIRSERLLARVALVDPELGVSAPPNVTAQSGMDALCQLIESYTSSGAQPMTDALAIQGIVRAARSLVRVYRQGSDLEAREDMALAAMWSGITLSNAGLGAVHGFAAPLGANYPAPHGAVCAALLPWVIDANIKSLRQQDKTHPVLRKYAEIGQAMGQAGDMGDAAAIDYCIGFARELLRELNIPPLREFGIKEEDVPAMVELARKSSSMKYNPVTLSAEALAEVLKAGILPG